MRPVESAAVASYHHVAELQNNSQGEAVCYRTDVSGGKMSRDFQANSAIRSMTGAIDARQPAYWQRQIALSHRRKQHASLRDEPFSFPN
jgi:hypothetical protein